MRREHAASVVRARCRAIGIDDQVRVEVLGTEAIFASNSGAGVRQHISPQVGTASILIA